MPWVSENKSFIMDINPRKNFGYVTLGSNFQLDDYATLASKALVFQIIALKGNFKCVEGYFLINKIGTEVLEKLINMHILKKVYIILYYQYIITIIILLYYYLYIIIYLSIRYICS